MGCVRKAFVPGLGAGLPRSRSSLKAKRWSSSTTAPRLSATPAFSFFIRCDSQEEIVRYRDIVHRRRQTDGLWLAHKPLRSLLADCAAQFRLIRHPKAVEAKMRTIKMDRPALAAGMRGNGEP
jgi:hypothetical protein